MKLIVGLGNPGKEYEKTRHNVGFRVADELARCLGEAWSLSEKFKASLLPPTSYLLAKPQTFMNLSGQSVSSLVRFYKLDPSSDLLVISDDKDMLFGKLRLRDEGSSGGHNGLESIIEHLGTEKFHRLKIGVGQEVARSAVRSEERLSSAKLNGRKDVAGRNNNVISSEDGRFPIEDQKISTAAFVLQKFSVEEEKQLPEIIQEASKKVKDWLTSNQ